MTDQVFLPVEHTGVVAIEGDDEAFVPLYLNNGEVYISECI